MTFYQHTNPRARKQHRCEMCGRTIQPGEVYRRGFGADGNAWTWKECAHCEQLVRVAFPRSWNDESYGDDLFNDFEPQSIAEARVRAQHRRRWQRLDGTLYPIPNVIESEDRYGFGREDSIEPGQP